uniref:Uncharacterized protein n=1 Tax=Arundo donax TaxID=35708 RepID=A0A0A9HIT0_ARUDO
MELLWDVCVCTVFLESVSTKKLMEL